MSGQWRPRSLKKKNLNICLSTWALGPFPPARVHKVAEHYWPGASAIWKSDAQNMSLQNPLGIVKKGYNKFKNVCSMRIIMVYIGRSLIPGMSSWRPLLPLSWLVGAGVSCRKWSPRVRPVGPCWHSPKCNKYAAESPTVQAGIGCQVKNRLVLVQEGKGGQR